MVRSEDGQIVGFVFVDVREGIVLADYVDLSRAVVADRVAIPDGYRLAWAGQFEYLERARARLQVLVPAALLLIFLMLYIHRGRLTETLIIMLALPLSLTGAVWLLWLLGYNLSVAVWIGMIAVAGLAVELGLLMMLYLDIAFRESAVSTVGDLRSAIVDGAARRIRPMTMTGLSTCIGLAPIMLATGAGADVMKRIAAPMIGGVVSALLTALIIFPAIYSIWRGHSLGPPATSR